MAKNATKKSTAARREQARFRDYKRGFADGDEWVGTCDLFEAREFVNKMGWDVPWSERYPWKKCSLPDLRRRLRSGGRAYTHAFMQAVQNDFQAEHSALVFHRHQEGVEDGRRWASDFANGGQHARVSNFAQSFWTREVFVGPDHCESWTPAHRLVAYLLDDAYPIGEDRKPRVDCTEFREFWQPFVKEPMDKVMSNLQLYGFRAGHKLQDRNYVVGFVDGVLGLSGKLGRRLSERTPTPLPNEGRTHCSQLEALPPIQACHEMEVMR